MTDVDHIIIGQGIAGSVLAFQLMMNHQSVVVINDDSQPCSSSVAAGIFNPITGRHFAETWLANELIAATRTFYRKVESLLSVSLLTELPTYRLFMNNEQANEWMEKKWHSNRSPLTDYPLDSNLFPSSINIRWGGFRINGSMWLDVDHFLTSIRVWLQAEERFISAQCHETTLKVKDTGKLEINGLTTSHIWFARGMADQNNVFFPNLPFRANKGEVLTVHIPDIDLDFMINAGIFLVPLGKEVYKIGSTYDREELSGIPTEKGKADLLEKLDHLTESDYTVLNHQAGIRPGVIDRRPLMGSSLENKNIHLFNGFGSKGVSLAPFWSNEAIQHVLRGIPLSPAVKWNRTEFNHE